MEMMFFFNLQILRQFLQIFVCRGPAGCESYDGVCFIIGFPEAIGDMFAEFLQLFVFEDEKLLVCGRFEIEGIAFFVEEGFELFCHANRVLTDAGVQIIGEQGIELDAKESAFG